MVRKTFLNFLVLIVFTSCGQQPEICDTNGQIYSIIKEQQDEWFLYFSELDTSLNNAINFNAYNHPFTVRSLYVTTDNTPVLSVSTNEGHPRTPLGTSGYIIFSSGEFDFPDDRYRIEELENRLLCYRRENN